MSAMRVMAMSMRPAGSTCWVKVAFAPPVRMNVVASLAKYEIPYREDEGTDELRDRLAAFYAGRSLTRTPIEPEDQAEAIFLLISKRLAKTTGHVFPVDGGLQDGFMR